MVSEEGVSLQSFQDDQKWVEGFVSAVKERMKIKAVVHRCETAVEVEEVVETADQSGCVAKKVVCCYVGCCETVDGDSIPPQRAV